MASSRTSKSSTPRPTPEIGLAELLNECRLPASDGAATWSPFEPCDDLTVSADGRYIAFLFGPEVCGRGIMIVDLEDDQTLYRTTEEGIAFEFLANGKILITTGYCEGGQFSLLDPATTEFIVLGGWSKTIEWNPSRTAIAVSVPAYHGFENGIWAYNVAEDLLFLEESDVTSIHDRPIWAPDGEALLFQRRAVAAQGGTYHFPSARLIVRVDATTGEQTILAADPRYDFHLCNSFRGAACEWHGDWIQIWRFPFHPQTIVYSLDALNLPEVNCLQYGLDCTQDPDLFALNWRTGQTIPWDEYSLPTPIPPVRPTWGPGSG